MAKYSPEKALVVDQLSSQMTQYHDFSRDTYNQLMNKASQIELATLDRLNEEGQISDREAHYLTGFVTRSIFRINQHNIWEFWIILWHRLKWRRLRNRYLRKNHQSAKPCQSNNHQLSPEQRQKINQILSQINQAVDAFLHSVETPANVNEVAMVRRTYFQRKRFFSHDITLNTELITTLSIEAFQLEHSYVQTQFNNDQISQELANALNEQISTDELVYMQSLD